MEWTFRQELMGGVTKVSSYSVSLRDVDLAPGATGVFLRAQASLDPADRSTRDPKLAGNSTLVIQTDDPRLLTRLDARGSAAPGR